jgi:hypothetical protein
VNLFFEHPARNFAFVVLAAMKTLSGFPNRLVLFKKRSRAAVSPEDVLNPRLGRMKF